MTGQEIDTNGEPDGPTLERPLDSEALREREDVTYTERTYTHEDTDHCAADAAGRVVVGITDGDEVLAVVDDPGEHAILPNCTVGGDEDWTTVARDTAERVAGAPVTLEHVAAVRRVEHVVEGDDEPHGVTFQVVFGASVDGGADPGVEDEGWTAGWFDEFPVPLDYEEEHGDAVDDVRRFLG
jgi:hypothetical protein